MERIQKTPEGKLIASLFILMATEALFQFPFDVPLSFLTLTVLFGFLLAQLPSLEKTPLPLPMRALGFLIFFHLFSFYFINQWAIGEKKRDLFFTQLACRLMPDGWRACDDFKIISSLEGKSQILIDESLKNLETQPYQFTALFYLAQGYHRQKRFDLSCRIGWFYDRLFHHKSMVHGFLRKKCPFKDQKALFTLPLKEHYKILFKHLPPEQQKHLIR